MIAPLLLADAGTALAVLVVDVFLTILASHGPGPLTHAW